MGVLNELHYEFPDGDEVLAELPLQLPSFPDVDAVLTVLRASGEDALSQSGRIARRDLKQASEPCTKPPCSALMMIHTQTSYLASYAERNLQFSGPG